MQFALIVWGKYTVIMKARTEVARVEVLAAIRRARGRQGVAATDNQHVPYVCAPGIK